MTRHAKRTASKSPSVHAFDPSRDRALLGKAFLTALAADFDRHGERVLRKVRNERRQDYLKLVAALLPKEFRIKEVELPDMTDEELASMLGALRTMIAQQQKQQNGDGGEAAQEPDEPRH